MDQHSSPPTPDASARAGDLARAVDVYRAAADHDDWLRERLVAATGPLRAHAVALVVLSGHRRRLAFTAAMALHAAATAARVPTARVGADA